MPLYMDRHDIPGASAADIAAAHVRDLETQGDFGVRFLTYWFDDDGADTGFCLVEGPDRESIEAAHRAAHGLMPSQVIEVDETVVRGFFGRLRTHPAGEPYVDSAFRAILFTDIVDSTRLTQELGDRAVMGLLHEHDVAVRGALGRYGGKEVKHTGDGIMAAFDSAYRGVGAAIDIQRVLHARAAEKDLPLRVRVGLAAGEPVTEHDDLFGAAVQQAARLCADAHPECILVSAAVHDLCRGKEIQFNDLGEAAVKGFADQVQRFEARWRD